MLDKKEERMFQLAMLETQIELENYLGVLIGFLAIEYSLLSYLREYLWATIAMYFIIVATSILLLWHYNQLKKRKFEMLRKKAIERL